MSNSQFTKHTLHYRVCDGVPDEHLNLHILICLVLQLCEPCFTFHTGCNIGHIHCHCQGISIDSSCPHISCAFQFFFRNVWFWIWDCSLLEKKGERRNMILQVYDWSSWFKFKYSRSAIVSHTCTPPEHCKEVVINPTYIDTDAIFTTHLPLLVMRYDYHTFLSRLVSYFKIM